MKLNFSRRAFIAATAVLGFTTTAAWAIVEDVENGASRPSLVSSGTNSGYYKFVTAAQSSSRSEYRGDNKTSSGSASGSFRVGTTGAKVSVLQVLNQLQKRCSTCPSSQPIAQLAVQSVSGGYTFFIVQGATPCNVPKFTAGTTFNLSTSFSKGNTVKFTISNGANSYTCTAPSARKPGTASSGETANGNFYAKLGAYNTASTASASTMYWKNGFSL
jgi:hypothetical protein